MVAKAIGQAACPECGHPENVMYDGRKHYIKCDDCKTFTTYQAKAAQARIQNRLEAVLPPNPQPDKAPETQPEAIPVKPPPTPARAGGFFESLDNLF